MTSSPLPRSRACGAIPACGKLFDLTYSDGEQYSLRTRDDVTNRRVPTEPASGYPKQADFLAWASRPNVGYRHR